MRILGFDPGGLTGAAMLRISGGAPVEVEVDGVASIDEALGWAERVCAGEIPQAVGVDTYLCWSTAPSGWRPVDLTLRESYPGSRTSVFCSNSARGAMAVQGMALALRLRERWPDILLNETHPKVLHHALSGGVYPRGDLAAMDAWIRPQLGEGVDFQLKDEHEWDALLSAWATWRGVAGDWNVDLVSGPDGDRLLFPAGRTTYFWPNRITS